MNLNNRISKLERTLGEEHCSCPNSADLAWPGHQPDPTCKRCGGQRTIYDLPHHPHRAEPLMRNVLPLFKKADDGTGHADLSKLTDAELVQLREALAAVEQVGRPG
jgi:hypothetical protein